MSSRLLARLASPDAEERAAACRDAAGDPAGTLFAEALARALGDPSKAVSRAAADALLAIGRRAGGVDEALRAALRSGSPRARFAAAFTSARLAPPSPRLLPALAEALASEDGDVRWAAARILVEMGRLHGEVLPVLVALARSGESPNARRMAGYALRALAPERPEAARVLLEATRDVELGVRRAALTALVALQDPPRELLTRLVEVLRGDADPPSRRLAALALGELGASGRAPLPEEARAALAEAALGEGQLRRAAERALGRLGEATAGAEERA